MKKNFAVKMVIIFFIIGILLIIGLSVAGIYAVNELETIVSGQENIAMQESIQEQLSQGKIIIIVVLATYTIISIIIGIIVAKSLVFPVKKLIQSAEKMTSGEKSKTTETRKNGEVGDIESAIDLMTNELR